MGPSAEAVRIDVSDVVLDQADGAPVRLGSLSGARVVVLLRHRH
jgi:hypothetical protein